MRAKPHLFVIGSKKPAMLTRGEVRKRLKITNVGTLMAFPPPIVSTDLREDRLVSASRLGAMVVKLELLLEAPIANVEIWTGGNAYGDELPKPEVPDWFHG